MFHDGGPYSIETSPLIYRANQWFGFYLIETSVMKELKELLVKVPLKNLEGTLDNSFSNYISVVVLPLGSLVQVALRKAPVIAYERVSLTHFNCTF